jgi:hypothetical protein
MAKRKPPKSDAKPKNEATPKGEPSASKDDDKVENWADGRDEDILEKCEKMYPTILKAYENRDEANDAIEEYWKIYNADPDENQMYVGNSKCYIPAVRDAINARAKRALKQLFPNKYKHVEAVGTDALVPTPQLSLLEHYIRSTKLKSIVRSMLVAGDVTGQWNLYIDWKSDKRTVTDVIRRPAPVETVGGSELEITGDEDVDETSDEEVIDVGPEITDFATEDLVVIPPTCNDIEKADIACLKLRMSKEKIQEMIDKGIFLMPAEDKKSNLSAWMDDRKGEEKTNPEKRRTHDAGIRTEGTNKYALIYEATARLEFEKGKKSLAYIYLSGENEVLGIIKAPQWGQKRPFLSAPVERVGGSFNGTSKIEPVKYLQWNLNDFWNMGQDSAMYSLLPVVMTDPEKNPNYAMMVFGLAAVWPVNPDSTKFQSFPALWKDSVQMCASIENQINKSLDVNEMMLGRMPSGRKNNAAMGAQQQEQSVSVMDHAARFEEEILNPLMERFFEYDAQFRDEEITVLSMGEIGVKAAMQQIPPQQWGNRYFFQWTGTSFVMGMQQMQQQIATMNVLRGIPPQQLNGRKLDICPILEIITENVFGAELGGRILIDERNKYSVPPEIEDEMMVNGIMTDVHEGDDDAQHIQSHQKSAQQSLDPAGLIRTHIQSHIQALQKKRQMAIGAQQPPSPGQPGVPGGGQAPGVAGTPRMGAQPAPGRPMQNPPGTIQQDNMVGAPGRG